MSVTFKDQYDPSKDIENLLLGLDALRGLGKKPGTAPLPPPLLPSLPPLLEHPATGNPGPFITRSGGSQPISSSSVTMSPQGPAAQANPNGKPW